ncbi:hypothetical protein FB639_003076 [Coemansia asiatica]|nr:hypothetical protein FB639_003076 [Coemansia asiatica]
MSASQPKTQAAIKATHEYHPVVKGALANIKKAQVLMHKDPSVAATVFWNIAKDISQYGNDSVTRSSLENAKLCLDMMNNDPSLRGTKGSTAFWSPRSLLKTSLECQMALARIDACSNIDRAAESYKSGLCQFLGLQHDKLDFVTASNRNPKSLEQIASRIVSEIPRKFAKEEDVDQAVAAMKEVASALILFSDGDANSRLASQGLAAYFIAYCFALSRDRSSDAFDCIKVIIQAFRFLRLTYMASECAALIIGHHANEPDFKTLVVRSVVDSILTSDLIRARELIQAFNLKSAEPWSVYLDKLIDKTITADVPWLSELALTEWQQIESSPSALHDPAVQDIIVSALEQHILAPYILYTPSLD